MIRFVQISKELYRSVWNKQNFQCFGLTADLIFQTKAFFRLHEWIRKIPCRNHMNNNQYKALGLVKQKALSVDIYTITKAWILCIRCVHSNQGNINIKQKTSNKAFLSWLQQKIHIFFIETAHKALCGYLHRYLHSPTVGSPSSIATKAETLKKNH